MNSSEVIQTKNIVNFGFATFVAAALLGNTPSAKAETPDIFTKHYLPIPGAYFAKTESQKAVTVAISKSGKGLGVQKKAASKTGKNRAQQTR
jgi:hypothetical protein